MSANTMSEEEKAAKSRMIATFGLEASVKLTKMKVLLYGARGLGFEVAKNLALAGPGELVIYD
jgi:molybdopterin/thiamine biosynthesis adenylyltransferase